MDGRRPVLKLSLSVVRGFGEGVGYQVGFSGWVDLRSDVGESDLGWEGSKQAA